MKRYNAVRLDDNPINEEGLTDGEKLIQKEYVILHIFRKQVK